jgi:hypothetical protein
MTSAPPTAPPEHRSASIDRPETVEQRAAELLAVALDHAARGWPVFPLVPGTKRPALHAAARCPRTGPCASGHVGWEQRATTDPDRIRQAWTAGARSGRAFNVGLPCGPAGLVVVDLDTPDPADTNDNPPTRWATRGVVDGAGVLAALALDADEQIPPTRTVVTPSGGRHLYFLAPTRLDGTGGQTPVVLRNTAGDRGRGLGWKVDTRAHGGYVVAAGSITTGPRGGRYALTDDRPPVPLPGWLTTRLLPPAPPPAPTGSIRTEAGRAARYIHAAITAETERVHGAASGQRNACLYVASVALGQLVAGGALAEHDARAVLLSAAGRHLALGAYSHHQAEQTITSGLRAGARRPRRIADSGAAGRAAGFGAVA